MMLRRPLLALIVLAVLSGGVHRSQAMFVAGTSNPANTITSATAFNSVAVTMSNPGTNPRGNAALSAIATSDRAIASVRFQSAPAGGSTWTDRCTATTAPYTCDWDTTAVADGLYDLRAIALDSSGYSKTSTTVASRRVDNTDPAVTPADPGVVTGSEALSATASDGGSGLADVVLSYRASGSSDAWTTICTDSSTPYGCTWNTAAVADGLYDLRAVATDNAGNTSTATVADRRVDNTAPTVSIPAYSGAQRGTLSIQATLDDGNGSGVTTVTYEYRQNGTTAWSPACTVNAPPFSCTADTTLAPDGLYDVRATATDGAGFTTSGSAITFRTDNTAPTAATLNAVASPVSGSLTLSGSGTDAGSGVTAMHFEYRATGTSTWSTACTDAAAPFSCAWGTTTVPDGSYELRAVATDGAGNTLGSAVQTARIVDNDAPTSVAVTSPGARVRAAATIAATAADAGSGVQSVAIQWAPSGSSSFTTICTDTSASYSCAWNTAARTDGSYDLRAVATDNNGHITTSAIVTTAIDNSAPAATDIQGANGGTAARLDNGDTLTFTYSAAYLPSSILAGWNGSSTAQVRVRVIENGTTDDIVVYDSTNTTLLGLTTTAGVDTNADLVGTGGAVLNATMTRPTTTTVRISFGTVASGSTKTGVVARTMTWNPSSAATNAAGEAAFTTPATETGALDLDV
jgi:hypothetical protein